MRKYIYILCAVAMMASCGTKKEITDVTRPGTSATTSPAAATAPELVFMDKVIAGGVTTENIVGNASVNLKFGKDDMNVPGALHMRKDKVIRIQLFVPILGTEVGRLEFTPDHVLVMDRLHKQYARGDYNQIEFLSDNGITFYSLQALFWNQLIAPGKQMATMNDAKEYVLDMSGQGASVPVTLTRGQMKYAWDVNRQDAKPTTATVTYTSKQYGTSTLAWTYSDFVAVGKKKFPKTQEFAFQTTLNKKKQQCSIKIKMNDVKTSNDWDTETTVSSKYKQVSLEELFTKLGAL